MVGIYNRVCSISKTMCSIRKCSIRKCIGKGSLHNSAGCKDSWVSLSLTFLPLSLDSRLLSFHRLGDNIGISIAVWVDSMVSIGVWKVVVSIGHSRGLDLNSLDDRLNIGIVKSIGVGVVKTIGEIVGISLWISLSLTLLPLSLDSRLLSFHRLGDNIGISIAVWVDSMVSIGVWKVVVSIGHSRGLDLNSLDDRLNIGIVKSIGVGVVKSIGEIVGISLWVSLGFSLTLLPLSLDSRLLSFYWLGDNIRISISIAVWVDSMVSIGVWKVVVSIGHSRGLDLNSLDDRLNIGIVKSIGVGVVKSIGEIVGISLWVSLGFSLTLLPLSLDSRLLISNGSSSRENNWESVSPETIVESIWDMSIGDNWSSLNLSGLYFNRLDNRQMRNSMVSSIHERSSVEKKLRISLSLSSDSSNEGNHQQELHVVIAM